MVPGFSKETTMHAFSAAAAVAAGAAVAAATLPVSLAGDIGKHGYGPSRSSLYRLRRRTIRFAGGLGDGGIGKRERHAAR